MNFVKINSVKHIRGTINLPGDKSISHRAAIFSAMANGESKIENFSSAADCASTLDCLENLGVEIRRDGTTVFIKGVGKNGFQKPAKDLDCGNSGTTVRLLAGVLAGQNFESVLTGDESLSVRPMKRVITPLEKMGAKIESENNCLPMKILRQKSASSNRIRNARRQRTGQIVRFACRIKCRRNHKSPKSENQSPKSVFQKSYRDNAQKSGRENRRKFCRRSTIILFIRFRFPAIRF